MISKELLQKEADKINVSLDETALERFDRYAELLVDWNKKINLTAITDPEGILYKHFIDSLVILKYIDIPKESKIIDVGTGAGFPGVALLIARPDLKLTLLDSTKKKLTVISDILENLNLSAEILHMRAEDAGKSPDYRETFDYATARAVTNLRDLAEICIPFVKEGGFFIPLKGAGAEEEINSAKKSITTMGGKITNVDSFSLNLCGERALITIKKINSTPLKYPRPSAQIAKKPII